MDREPGQQPYLLPKPRCFGVRCPCGAYMAIEEIHGDPRQAYCARLERPAWIVCVDCGVERQYTQNDLVQFDWPPADSGTG